MVVTLQQILRLLYFTCFIMGLGYFPRKQSNIRWITHLNILYSLTIWSAYTYLAFCITTQFTWKILFDSVPMEIVAETNFLLSITSVIMSFYHQKRFEISINKLAAVDDTLEKLGTPKMYQKLHVKSIQMIIGWIVYSLTINLFDTIWWLNLEETSSWGLFIAFPINYCTHFNTFVDMFFIFFLWYIGTRFDKVNEHMQCLLMREDHGLRCAWNKSVVILRRYTSYTDYKQILWSSMHLHLELSRLTRELNLVFTVQMTFEIASHFLFLTSLFYYLYCMLIQKGGQIYTILQWFTIIFWVSIYLMKLYIVNYICENVTVKANKIGKLFHELANIYRYADVWKEIYQFTLQTMHHPLKLTGMGLFYFDHEFFRKFYTAIATYVIIMVQFKILIFSQVHLTIPANGNNKTSILSNLT